MDRGITVVASTLLVASIVIGFSSSLQAIDYTFVEARLLLDAEIDDDGFEDDGAGYIHPLDAAWDANVSLAYASYEADGPRGDDDESGYGISGGVRGMVKPQIEVRAMLNHYKIEGSDTYFTLGGDYYLRPNVSAGVEFDLAGDYETFSIGAKYHF